MREEEKSKLRVQIGEVAGTIGGISLYLENHNLTCGKKHAELLRKMERKLEEKESWEVEFDKKFIIRKITEKGVFPEPLPHTYLGTDIKQFISQALQAQRAELLEKLPKEKKPYDCIGEKYSEWNDCLSEVKKIIGGECQK